MNMKNLVVSLAFAGVVVSPVSFAVSSALESAKFKASEQPATLISQLNTSQSALKSPDGVLTINNMITIAQAHQVVAGRSSGRVISVMLDTEYGAPKYEFIVIEGTNVKSLLIHGESGAVIAEHTFSQNVFQPAASLSAVLANVELALSANVVAAELEADENSGAYRVLATKDNTFVEVIASGETGGILAAVTYADDMEDDPEDEGNGEDDGQGGNEEPAIEFISLATAIAAAEQAAPGSVVAIGLDDEMEEDDWDDDWDDEGEDDDWDDEDEDDDWDDEDEDDDWDDEDEDDERNELIANKAFLIGGELPVDLPIENNDEGNKDDGEDEMSNPTFVVELQEGLFIHRVNIDAVTGEVVEVELDDYQALEQAVAGATTWASLNTVLTNAATAQVGNVVGVDLMLLDSTLVYEVVIEADDADYIAIVNAASGEVLSVIVDDGEQDDEETDGEDDSEGGENGED